MRRFCMFMVAVLVATLIVPVRDAAVGADAAYAAWPSCTNDQKWTAGASGEPKRCINGVPYTTRRYLYAIPGCLAPAVNNLYPSRRFCSGNGGLEAIGQARAIRYLSDHLEPDPTRLISPNVQWEMFQGRKRPDIVVYDRNNAAAGVDVIEAKWEENDDYADWPNQVDGYINYFRAQGMPNVRRGATLNRWGPYLDVFEVMDNDTDCKTATGTSGKVRRTYEATSPQAGLLDIRENKSKRKCEDNPNPVPTPTTTAQPTSQPTSEPTSQPTPQPTTVPVPPFVYPLPEIIEELETVGASSLAEDIAAAGGVEEATELLIAEIYAELGTAEGAALLADAGFISVELALAGGVVALVALLAFFIWWYIHHHGGNAGGDPHFHTIDGLHYDLQSAGEFTMAHSEFYGMEIQGRLVPMSSSSGISVLKRVATELNDHTVEFEGGTMYVDGVARTLADGHILFFGEDKFVIKKNGAYFVLYRGLAGPLFIWNGSASLYVPQAADNDLQGLFGNANGDPQDDLKLIDGTQLPWDASATVRHGDFADSWRIGDDQSLFAYAAGQSTGTFTDLTFPHNVTTVHDLTADQITLATTSCENAGVQPGPSFTNCILDVALTADDTYATAAAQAQTVAIDPAAQGLDASGHLAVDFQAASLPTNVMPARVSTDTATGAFAGPFSGTASYRFYVQSLPAHLGGTLSFDLLALGDWTAGTDTKTIQVTTDRGNPVTVTPSALTPTATGTLATGVPFTKYRVTVPLTHSAAQIEVKISATGVTGIANLGFGVDNVDLTMPIVPPQSFAVSVPFTVTDGVPATGAGNMETEVSEDDYTFSAAAGDDLYIAFPSCPTGSISGLHWSLLNAAGTTVASSSLCTDGEVRDLAAGDYRLKVSADGDRTGTYKVAVTPIAADAAVTITAGGTPAPLTITTPGQNGAWTFTGTAGQKVYVDLTGGTFRSYDLSTAVYGPDGTKLTGTQYCGTACGFGPLTLPADGAYTVRVNPQGSVTGAVSAKLYNVPGDPTVALATNGTATTVTTTVPGQNGVWTFDGTSGQRVYFDFSGGTVGQYNAGVTVLKPDGTTLVNNSYCGTSCGLDSTVLPADGTYKIVFDPDGDYVGSLTAKVNVVGVDAAATLAADGTPVTLTTTSSGQNGAWTFTGTAGQKVFLDFSGGTFPSQYDAYVSVVAPDGTKLINTTYCGHSCTLDTTTLPVDGAYKVVLDPLGNTTGALTAKLYAVPADASANTTIGAAPVTLTSTVPGQNFAYTFTATAGQRVFLKFTGGTFGCCPWVSVRKPDGTQLVGTSISSNDYIDTTTLPVGGAYKVVVDPSGSGVGSVTLQVTDVPADAQATAAVDGSPVTVTMAAAGQNGVLSFDAAANQKVFFKFTNTMGCCPSVTLRKPDGSTLVSTSISSTDTLGPTTLPVAGTYSLYFNPSSWTTGAVTTTITSVPSDVAATTTIDGAATTVTTTASGQNAAITFTGTANQRVYFAFTNNTMGCCPSVTVRNPDGTTLTSTSITSNDYIDTKTLPADGTYTVYIDPAGTVTGSVTVRVTNVPADVAATTTIDGTATTLTTTAAGQNSSLTFAGTAGQRVFFKFTNNTYGCCPSVTIRNPDGTTLSSTSVSTNDYIDTKTLPADGTYTILVNPSGGVVGALTTRVTSVPADAAATATIGGSAVTLTTTAPGQNGVLTFNGTAGHAVTIAFSGNTMGYPSVTVRRPDGTTLKSTTVVSTSDSISNLTLPDTGAYTIAFNPSSWDVGAITTQLTDVPPDASATAVVGGDAVTVTTTAPGQNAAVTFTGTAGQRVFFKFTNNTIGCCPTVTVRNPDGSSLVSTAISTNDYIDTKVLPADGTYTVYWDPSGLSVGSVTTQLYAVPADAAAPITVNGSAVTLTTTVPGQNGVYSFSGTAGQRVFFKFTNNTIGCCPSVTVRKPDGTTLVSTSISTNDAIDTTTLPVDGASTRITDIQRGM